MVDQETPQAAVMREAEEETGLRRLELAAALVNFEHDMTEFGVDEIQHA